LKMGPVAADEKEIPEVCRKEVIEWDREVVRVGDILLGLLSEGLGLSAERLTELGLSQGRVMVGHYYPFCPQPNLTVGLNSHADPGALTVVLQDHIGGLQVRTQQGWVNVKPLDGALVINIGDLLQWVVANVVFCKVIALLPPCCSRKQKITSGRIYTTRRYLPIISNEEYKSADHRVLANPANEPRVSIAVFLNPGDREKLFGPLPELTSAEKPALYRDFTLNEFMTRFFTKELDGKSLTNFFRQ
ncbi:1-aminocyclopropane-1-carboxylate oxidase 4-like protein, partial [Trifolium pratense]